MDFPFLIKKKNKETKKNLAEMKQRLEQIKKQTQEIPLLMINGCSTGEFAKQG